MCIPDNPPIIVSQKESVLSFQIRLKLTFTSENNKDVMNSHHGLYNFKSPHIPMVVFKQTASSSDSGCRVDFQDKWLFEISL